MKGRSPPPHTRRKYYFKVQHLPLFVFKKRNHLAESFVYTFAGYSYTICLRGKENIQNRQQGETFVCSEVKDVCFEIECTTHFLKKTGYMTNVPSLKCSVTSVRVEYRLSNSVISSLLKLGL